MDEVYGWVEDQRQARRDQWRRFEAAMRAKWTPARVLNGCCFKWLADGSYSWCEFEDEYSFRNGCDNARCQYAHPAISISFADGKVVARLSHQFDSFGSACLESDLWPESEGVYTCEGPVVRGVVESLRAKVGRHLVSLAPGALEASDAAWLAANATPVSRTTALGLDAVFPHVCRFADLVSLAMIHGVSVGTCRAARHEAQQRLRAVVLKVQPLVNGMMQHGEDKLGDIGDSEEHSLDGADECGDVDVCVYSKRDPIQCSYDDARRCFTIDEQPAFKWNSGELRVGCDEDDRDEEFEEHYRGQQLRVYWHEPQGVTAGLRTDLYGDKSRRTGVRIAKIRLGEQPALGTCHEKQNGVRVTLEVLKSTRDETSTQVYDDDDDDDHSENEDIRVRYTGTGQGHISMLLALIIEFRTPDFSRIAAAFRPRPGDRSRRRLRHARSRGCPGSYKHDDILPAFRVSGPRVDFEILPIIAAAFQVAAKQAFVQLRKDHRAITRSRPLLDSEANYAAQITRLLAAS